MPELPEQVELELVTRDVKHSTCASGATTSPQIAELRNDML